MGSYSTNYMGPAEQAGPLKLHLSELEMNAKKLSKKIYIFAFFLEICVIFLGVYAAVLVNGSGLSGSALFNFTFIYLAIISVAEFAKVLTCEAVARYQSPGLVLFATVALSISLYFTLENLLNVSSLLQHQTIEKVTELNRKKNDLTSYIENQNSRILSLKNKKDSLKPLSTGSEHKNIQKVIKDIRKDITQRLMLIREIKEKNNSQEKNILYANISTYQSSINNLEKRLAIMQENFVEEIGNLENNKLTQLENTAFYRKSSVMDGFNKRIGNLETDYKNNKDKLLKDIDNFSSMIKDTQKMISDLSQLSGSSISLINDHRDKLSDLEKRESNLLERQSLITKEDDTRVDIFNSEIKAIEGLIHESQNLRLSYSEDLNKVKNQNWLFKNSSIFYRKEPSLVSIQELKEFSFWFISLACVGLALLGPILIILSVQLERNYSSRQEKWFWKKTLKTFKDVSGDIVKTVSSEKRFRARTKKIEEHAAMRIEKNQDLINKALQEKEHKYQQEKQQHEKDKHSLLMENKQLEKEVKSTNKRCEALETDQNSKQELAQGINNLNKNFEIILKNQPKTKVIKKLIPLSLLDDLKKKGE